MDLIWFPTGYRLTAADYIEILRTKFIPSVQENFPDGNAMLQQDGAPAHTSKVCKLRYPNIAALKATVNQEWTGMDEDFVVKVCQAFRKHLMAI
ncbi:Uncharacterized protein FKW44_015888, partial [Caligus rogercresseyi]